MYPDFHIFCIAVRVFGSLASIPRFVDGVNPKINRRDPWATITFLQGILSIYGVLGGCRSHDEGGTLKEKF